MSSRSLFDVLDRQVNGRLSAILRSLADQGMSQEDIAAELADRYEFDIDRSQVSRWFSSGRVPGGWPNKRVAS